MTDSTDEKAILREPNLSPQKEDFDFDLVDVQVIPDHIHPAPIHLDDTNEPSPIKTDFYVDYQTEPTESAPSLLNNDETITPNRFGTKESLSSTQVVPEVKTNFYVDYFDKRKKVKTTLIPDLLSEPIISDTVQQETPAEPEPVVVQTIETVPIPPAEAELPLSDENASLLGGSGMAVAILSQFKSKQESINKHQEQLIQEFSGKIKKTTAATYTAVAFGIVALAAAMILGSMLLKTKSELSDLAGTTTALKDNIRNIKTTPEDGLEGTDPAIDQLSQKVDTLTVQLRELSVQKATHSEKKPPVAELVPAVTNTPAALVAATPAPAPAVDKPIEKKLTSEKAPAPVAKTAKPSATENSKTAKAAEANAKPVKATPATKKASNTKASHTETAAPVVTIVDVPEKKPAAKKIEAAKVIEKTPSVPVNDINKLNNASNPQTAITIDQTATPPAATPASTSTGNTKTGGWTVNLGSSNKLDDAKRTAASFAQKGIPVAISAANAKGETRYRLQVKGFKNKEEAATYANKAKDALKLNSVWINP